MGKCLRCLRNLRTGRDCGGAVGGLGRGRGGDGDDGVGGDRRYHGHRLLPRPDPVQLFVIVVTLLGASGPGVGRQWFVFVRDGFRLRRNVGRGRHQNCYLGADNWAPFIFKRVQ